MVQQRDETRDVGVLGHGKLSQPETNLTGPIVATIGPGITAICPWKVPFRPSAAEIRPWKVPFRPTAAEIRPWKVPFRPTAAAIGPWKVPDRPSAAEIGPWEVPVRPKAAAICLQKVLYVQWQRRFVAGLPAGRMQPRGLSGHHRLIQIAFYRDLLSDTAGIACAVVDIAMKMHDESAVIVRDPIFNPVPGPRSGKSRLFGSRACLPTGNRIRTAPLSVALTLNVRGGIPGKSCRVEIRKVNRPECQRQEHDGQHRPRRRKQVNPASPVKDVVTEPGERGQSRNECGEHRHQPK